MGKIKLFTATQVNSHFSSQFFMHMLQRVILLLLFIFLPQTFGFTQENTRYRLNSNWEFCQSGLGGPWEVWRDKQHQVLPWQKISLPHCYNAFDAVDPDIRYYQGEAWYRKLLSINNPFPGGRTLLHFEGAGQKTSVYIHTKKVGEHVGGYDEFTVDITDAIAEFSQNKALTDKFKNQLPLAICSDNSRDLEMMPSNLSDFNVYGGLYRYVNLVYVPVISIEQVQIQSNVDPKGKKGSYSVSAKLYNPEQKGNTLDIAVRITDPKGNQVFLRQISEKSINNEMNLCSEEIKNPELWSPDQPALYECHVTIKSTDGTMQVTEKFGFRNFEFTENGPFFLNGERLLLKGTHRHEDHAGVGAAISEPTMHREMQMIKDMGANFIRLGHYQQSRIILDLCDSLGILVWEEIPWCRGGLGGETYREQGRRMLRNMINQHYNHPSVILWGLGNENDWAGDFESFEKDSIRGYMSELNAIAHQLDPSRKTSIRRCDFCSDIPDVYSPSIWAGWYRGLFTEYKKISLEEMKKTKHFFHAEWGADSHVGRFNDNPLGSLSEIPVGEGGDEREGDYLHNGGSPRVSKDGDWSESYFCELADWYLYEQRSMDWLTGSAQWAFTDFSTPLRPENPIPFVNQKGLVQRDLTPKESYYVFQSYWSEIPMVHILGHGWDIRSGKIGEAKQLKIYSNCAEVELFVNGVSAGVKKRNKNIYPASGLKWDVVFREGTNTLKAVATSGKQVLHDEISFLYQTAICGVPELLSLQQLGSNGDTISVCVSLTDKNGTRCLDGNQVVHFGITGNGRLIDNLGTSNGSRVIQLANGKACIRVVTEHGTSVISAGIENFETAFLKVSGPGENSDEDVFSIPEIKKIMAGAFNFQLQNPTSHPKQMHVDNNWVRAVLYTGVMDAWKSTHDSLYLKEAIRWSNNVKWKPGPRFRHADDLVCGQVYADIALETNRPERILPLLQRVDSIMHAPMLGREDWWWCDALYMAPPLYTRISEITGDQKYTSYMNHQFRDVTEFLYDQEEHLFYRDDRYFSQLTKAGEKVFWSRGNGWVMGGIARLYPFLPANDPSRDFYIRLFQEMASEIKKAQLQNGLWSASLLDPMEFPAPETSGSAFFCYSLAWGINEGILNREEYLPCVQKAWGSLVKCVHEDGKLGWVQPIGAQPDQVTADDTQAYGVGAFLLAGSEMLKLNEEFANKY